jgi:hypothetical protein
LLLTFVQEVTMVSVSQSKRGGSQRSGGNSGMSFLRANGGILKLDWSETAFCFGGGAAIMGTEMSPLLML